MGNVSGTAVPVNAKCGPNRVAGNFLNVLGYSPVHERFQQVPRGNLKERMVVCRCWLSLKYPICDNTHQQLWKQGINVGPCMVQFEENKAMTRLQQISATAAEYATPVLQTLQAYPKAVSAGAAAVCGCAGVGVGVAMAGAGGSGGEEEQEEGTRSKNRGPDLHAGGQETVEVEAAVPGGNKQQGRDHVVTGGAQNNVKARKNVDTSPAEGDAVEIIDPGGRQHRMPRAVCSV